MVESGDWVRFYRNGVMVLSAVQYVRPAERWPHHVEVLTDNGVVAISDILEVRTPTGGAGR